MSHSDRIRELQEDRRKLLKAVEELQASIGWKYVCESLTAAYRIRQERIFSTEDSMDGALVMMGVKGELRGIKRAMEMPQDMVDQAAEDIETLQLELQDEETDND